VLTDGHGLELCRFGVSTVRDRQQILFVLDNVRLAFPISNAS
jgi:hypothetical protein